MTTRIKMYSYYDKYDQGDSRELRTYVKVYSNQYNYLFNLNISVIDLITIIVRIP